MVEIIIEMNKELNIVSIMSMLINIFFIIGIIKFNLIKILKIGFVLKLSMFEFYIILWC